MLRALKVMAIRMIFWWLHTPYVPKGVSVAFSSTLKRWYELVQKDLVCITGCK